MKDEVRGAPTQGPPLLPTSTRDSKAESQVAADQRACMGIQESIWVPVAASVYYEDMFVNFKLAMETASQISSIRLWITNEFMHSGLCDGGRQVFDHLMGRSRCSDFHGSSCTRSM
ncbi:hypothetical protein C1H46_013065 [Malus baccata]|uniref:Uncharacterized protein n=1 Tax=Malus baccata TaxID=106549 RepID=A0A540MR89_MALBA|nr:hypothetical protein C1H46_013065 [Malus baccata]